MSKITITIDEQTASFILSGFAYTKFTGKAAVKARRAVAEADFLAALAAQIREPDPTDCTQCGDTDRVEQIDGEWLCAGCQLDEEDE